MQKLLKNKNVLWNIIGITLNASYSLFLIIFITRLNGIDVSGQFSFAFYITSLFSTIGLYGGRIFQITDVSKKYNNGNFVSVKFITSTLMLLVTLTFCILNSYNFTKLSLIMLLVLYRVIEGISESYYGIMQKNDNLAAVGKSMALKVVISCIIFTIINLITKNILISSFSLLIGYSAIFFFYDRFIIKKYGLVQISFAKRTIDLLKESFLPFLFAFLTLFVLNIARYFVDLRLDDTAQGIYGIIVMPASLIALFAQFMIQPAIKSLVDMYHENHQKAFFSTIKKILILLFVIGILTAIIVYLIGPEILSWIYDTNIKPFRLELSLIILAGIFSGAVTIISSILTLMRKMKIQLFGFSMTIIIAIILSIYFIHNQISTALYVFVISMFIQCLIFMAIYFFQIKKELKNERRS